MKTLILAPVIAVVLLAACGCRYGDIPTDTGGIVMSIALPNGVPSTETMDYSLANHIQLFDPKFKEVGDIVHAQIGAKNLRNYTARCEYKMVFYDESGFEMKDAKSGWKQIVISGGETVQLDGVATSPGARKCSVTLRYEKAIRD